MKHKKNLLISHIQAFWSRILSLPFGRRLIFFSAILAIIFLFFPWFSEAGFVFNAFGKFPIFGVLILLFSVFALLLILREIISHTGFLGSVSHGNILIILFAQGLYTVILANFTLYGLLPEKSDYAVNIGVMLVFIAMGIGLAGAIFSKEFIPKGRDKNVFMDTDNVDTASISMQAEKQLSLGDYEDTA